MHRVTYRETNSVLSIAYDHHYYPLQVYYALRNGIFVARSVIQHKNLFVESTQAVLTLNQMPRVQLICEFSITKIALALKNWSAAKIQNISNRKINSDLCKYFRKITLLQQKNEFS